MNDKRVEAAIKAWQRFVNEASIRLTGKEFRVDESKVRVGLTNVLAASDAAAWQPIETAPRDGTLILVAVKHIGCDVVSFWGAGWRETTNGLMLRDEPTHWQPLPAPPSDATP